MKYLTLAQIKQQCVIDAEYDGDDAYLEALGDTCEQAVERQVNCKLEDLAAENDGDLPMPLVHAMKMLVEYLYSNRGGEDVQIPESFYYLCHFFRQY